MGKGALYLRPLLMGSGPILGLGPAPSYTFAIYGAAVGSYFKVRACVRVCVCVCVCVCATAPRTASLQTALDGSDGRRGAHFTRPSRFEPQGGQLPRAPPPPRTHTRTNTRTHARTRRAAS